MFDRDFEQTAQHPQQIALRRWLAGLLANHRLDMVLLQRGDAFVAMHTAECFEDIAVGLLRDRLVLGEAVMLLIGDNDSDRVHECPLSGVKWTSKFKSVTSAFDPKRT
jgi:hypothetical protein